jgi:hypothetical protein
MPGLSPSNSAVRLNSAFSCSGVRVSNTVIWMNTTSSLQTRHAVAEVRSVMLGDGHELVVFGHVERFTHRAVKLSKIACR